MATRMRANSTSRPVARPVARRAGSPRSGALPSGSSNSSASGSSASVWRWVGWLVVGGLVAVSAGMGRYWLAEWLVARTEAQRAALVGELSAVEAARYVRQLPPMDEATPATLVVALADERPEVAHAAAESLSRAVTRWSELRPAEAAPRVAILARELAEAAPQLDDDRQYVASRLAERLIVWPIESPGESAATIAACESVLRLRATLPWDDGLRVASLPTATETVVADEPPPEEDLPPVVMAPIVPPPQQPRPILRCASRTHPRCVVGKAGRAAAVSGPASDEN
jgi:hypothetical protein